MAAKPITVGDLLAEVFPRAGIAGGLEKIQIALETLVKQIFAGIEWVREMADRVERAPPVPGYESMLIERGYHPLMARAASYWLIRSGTDEANKIATHGIVADALRFLAEPRRTQGSIARRVT